MAKIRFSGGRGNTERGFVQWKGDQLGCYLAEEDPQGNGKTLGFRMHLFWDSYLKPDSFMELLV